MTTDDFFGVPSLDFFQRLKEEALRGVSYNEHYLFCANRYFAWLGYQSVVESLKRYISFLKKTKSPASISFEVFAIKLSIKKAAWKLLSGTEAFAVEAALKKIRAPKNSLHAVSRNFLLNEEDQTKLFSCMGERDRLLLQFLLKTGARISEALSIRLKDIRFEKEAAVIPILGKGGKVRTLRVELSLIRAICSAYQGATFLFETRNGNPLSRNYAGKRIREAALKIGKKFSPHCARHTFASKMIEQTGKIEAVSRYLGHSSPAITLALYTHQELSNEELGINGRSC